MAGHFKDENILAAVGVSMALGQIMILSVMIGLNVAIESLTSTAYGNKNIELCGVYLNRGRMVLLVFFIPLGIGPFFFGEEILLFTGQDPEVSRIAGAYIRYIVPAYFFFAQNYLNMMWLVCMRTVHIFATSQVISTILYFPLSYMYVNVLDMGYLGLGFAFTS